MTPSLNLTPISALYLFAVYLTRASYQATFERQAPPFDPTKPVKNWFDRDANGQPYLMFDTTAGKLITMPLPAAIASSVNLPGSYNYPAFVETPTDATQNCLVSEIAPTPIDPATLCLQTEAQAIAKAIAFLFAGKTVTVAQQAYGMFYGVFPADELRRQWCILVNGVSPYGAGFDLHAKTLILGRDSGGVGAPQHWIYAPADGEPANDPTVQSIPDEQITLVPAGAMTLPVPIEPLAADQQFVLVPPSNALFGQATWMVETIPPPPVVTLAEVQQLVAQYNAQAGVAAIAIA
jgi:hypothetical protein